MMRGDLMYSPVHIPECCKENLSELLLECIDFFNKNNIRYWVDWGTLLGLVRDKGLIPWDKDVDFGVLREEERKLGSAFSEHAE